MQGTTTALHSIAGSVLVDSEANIFVDVFSPYSKQNPLEDSFNQNVNSNRSLEVFCDDSTEPEESDIHYPIHLSNHKMNSIPLLCAGEPFSLKQQILGGLSPLWNATDPTTIKSSFHADYLQSSSSVDVQPCDGDVDSRDASPVHDPIHCFRISNATSDSSVRCNADFEADTQQETVCFDAKPRLTLSAFRRPEQTIRLTHADPNRRLESEYDLQAPKCGVLGHGAFSTVRLAVRRCDGIKVAVKSIAKHEALRSRRLRFGGRSYLEEWEILRRFQHHPYVITLIDVLENDEEIQIVTEYCQGGELFDAIQRKRNRLSHKRRGQYTEPQAARITSQILSALVDLHEQGIVHRDVKPENILLANDDESMLHVKLCDFGVARPLCDDPDSPHYSNMSGIQSDGDTSPVIPGRSASFSTIGTDYYAAPEMVFGGSYTTALDVYSLGVTLYILLCGFPPVFSCEDDDEVVFPISYWKDISDEAKDLLRKMLHPDPTERISAKEAMRNKWIQENMERSHSAAPHPLIPSPPSSTSRKNQLDLNLVRNQLLRSLEVMQAEKPMKRLPNTSPSKSGVLDSTGPNASSNPSPFKRARCERRGSIAFLALADLYRGVGTTPSGMMAASTAVDSVPATPRLDDDAFDELATKQHEQSKNLAALSF